MISIMPYTRAQKVAAVSIGCNILLFVGIAIYAIVHAQMLQRYPYLSRRIFAENQNDILVNFIPLRTAMRDYVASIKEPIGVYFEYLPSGVSIGINDRREFAIASLIKTPLAMAVYRNIEEGKLSKQETITLTSDYVDNGFGDLWKQPLGTVFTIDQLIHILLQRSDNTASKMLRSVVSQNDIQKVFDSLDIDTDNTNSVLTISPKSYSSVLRSLYLSSFLERKSSNEILDILTTTPFNNKLASGIPADVKVAHKIGVWDLDAKDGKGIIYSDCGIVYVPSRPYLLCIMTKSTDEKAAEYMGRLSKMTYSYVSQARADK